MEISYNKLWKLLIENIKKKKDLQERTGISEYTIKKLNHCEPVSMDVMMKLCKLFHCDIGDLMEIIEEEN